MSSRSADVQQSHQAAMLSDAHMRLALRDYHAACSVGDWDSLERLRLLAIGSLESFLDHTAAAHRRLQE